VSLLVHPGGGASLVTITPESVGWGYVGFEALRLEAGAPVERDTAERECCVVVIEGDCAMVSAHGEWELGGRADPWAGPPEAAYLPPRTAFTLEGEGEVALCFAPAPNGAAPARVLPGAAIEPELRGFGNQQRTVLPILMGDEAADSLLVCEVRTPPGHWSSYPPHKHDRDAMPEESFLEETYYHRVRPARGFALMRVYTRDRELDETLAVGDRDTVLVPRGYHTVSTPPGYDLYYLNVMAGPVRAWAIANDPDHEWMLQP
jgi:5-deoxy-glucuronate isomerase